MRFLHELVRCGVPLFVAVDAVGVLPLFVALTEGMSAEQRRRALGQSLVTAAVVALAFIWLGRAVLRLLGITVQDFMIAGGAMLFVISLNDLLAAKPRRRAVDPDSLGVVPIGVPLITGPAVLTTSLLLLNEYGALPTAAALLLNVALAGAVFAASGLLLRILGRAGAKAVSKVASLLLAAIAVMMMRKGIVQLLAAAGSP